MQTAKKVNILNEHTSSDGINSQLKAVIKNIQKLSTEEVTVPIQRLKSVSPTKNKKRKELLDGEQRRIHENTSMCEVWRNISGSTNKPKITGHKRT